LSAFSVGSSITIDGGSAGLTVARSAPAGTPGYRLFDVAAGGALTLQHLTLRGGLAPFGTVSGPGSGGAIFTRGSLTVSNSTLAINTGRQGGGIFAVGGNLTVANSTLAGNSAADGGGIDASQASVTVTNSTLAGNTATAGSSATGGGGGIFIDLPIGPFGS